MPKTYHFADHLLPISRPPVEYGFLALENGRIAEMGKVTELAESLRPKALGTPDDPKTLITPGLVNVHTHLEQSFDQQAVREPDETMTDWLLKAIGQIHGELAGKEARCEAGVREVLASGTTCVNDIASDMASLKALDKAGLRGVVSLEFFHPDAGIVQIDHIVSAYEAMQALYGSHSLLRLGLSPHSPFNVSPVAWQAVLKACKPQLVHTHLAESADETQWFLTAGKKAPQKAFDRLHQTILKRTFHPQMLDVSPVGYLHAFRLLEGRLIAAHGVETDVKDRKLIAKAGVALAHCPRSNLHLQGKTLCWEDWIDLGKAGEVRIGLGTDGRLSTENLDLRAEARAAMNSHNWSAEYALRQITLEGARVLGLSQEIGSLEVGKQADLAFWEFDKSEGDLFATAMFAQTRCAGVMVSGRKLSF